MHEVGDEAASGFGGYLLGAAATFAAVFLCAWIYVASFPMAFLPGGYPAWVAKSTMLKQCQLGQVAFFGDSRLESGVVPKLLPVEATNFGLAAGTALEVHSAVRRVLACETPPAQVVISLIPSHLGVLDRYFWLNTLLYGFVSPSELLDLEAVAAELNDKTVFTAAQTPEGLSGRLRNWIYAAGMPMLYFSSLVEGRVFGRAKPNQTRLQEVLLSRGYSSYGEGQGAAVPAAHKTFVASPLQVEMLERTLAMARARGVDVLLMAMPTADMTADQASVTEERRYLDFLQDIARRHPGTQLLTPAVPRWPQDMFVDGVHLNNGAARLFSQMLAGCFVDQRLRAGCDLSWAP